ncbi:MAG TPA: acyl-CoA dehydrogenase [Thermoanaerobaculia bacterium]|nr:acyl-CoA dehydrogenase [Thermoanaerobaculia bacterium]
MPLDFSLTAAQQEVQKRARGAFAPLRGWWKRGRHGDFAEAAWEALAGSGLLGTIVPREDGGTGEGVLALALALEELGASGLPTMLPILTAIDAIGIARHGTPELRREVLPRVAAGKIKLCLALTEEEAGFNTFRTKTRAERAGDTFRLHGAKIYISGADVADYLLVLARSLSIADAAARGLPKTAGLTWLLVPAGAPGIRLEPLPTHGEGTLRQFAIELDGVEVPAANLLGREGEGFRVLVDLVNPERILLSAQLTGAVRYCLEIACEHARTRKVFDDVAIGAYQSVQHPLAEVRIRQEAVQIMAWRAAALYDAGAHPKEVSFQASAAKFLAAELGVQAVDAALTTLGGKGFDERYGIFHLLEMVNLLKIAPVGDALLLNLVAEGTLGLPRSY